MELKETEIIYHNQTFSSEVDAAIRRDSEMVKPPDLITSYQNY